MVTIVVTIVVPIVIAFVVVFVVPFVVVAIVAIVAPFVVPFVVKFVVAATEIRVHRKMIPWCSTAAPTDLVFNCNWTSNRSCGENNSCKELYRQL